MGANVVLLQDRMCTAAEADLEVAEPADADFAYAEPLTPLEPRVDFIAQARSRAAVSVPVDLVEQFEGIHSSLDTPIYRAMTEDLCEILAAPLSRLLRRRGVGVVR